MGDLKSGERLLRRLGRRNFYCGCAMTLMLVSLSGWWLFNLVYRAREAARDLQCQSCLNQLSFALYSYHDAYGTFPPAVVADEGGKPLYSWRVLLLPYLGFTELYDEFDLNASWDSPQNMRLAARTPPCFRCPSGPLTDDPQCTNYVVVRGPGTAFPGTESTSVSDFQDGVERTILLVEIANSTIHWMEPGDLDVAQMSFVINDARKPSISSPHPRGPGIVLANNISVYRCQPDISPAVLKNLTTIAGGEPVAFERPRQRNRWAGRSSQAGEANSDANP